MTETEFISIEKDGIRKAAERAGEILKNGGIVAFPTDTVYGLGASCFQAEAVRNIFAAKGRPESKPLSILVSDIRQVSLLTDTVSEEALALMQQFWPGALTLIFRIREEASIPEEVTAGGSTIGIRMPDSEIARQIIASAQVPLAAPSANRSGNRSSVNAQEVREDLEGRVDLIIDGGSCPVGISSTVLDVSTDNWKILREGTVTGEMIEKVTGKNIGEQRA